MRKKNNDYKFDTVNDIRNFIIINLVSNTDDYKERDENQMFIINSIENEEESGFVFNTKKIIESFAKVFDLNCLNFMMDSTYKITYNKWILTTIGSNTIYYKKKEEVQSKIFAIVFLKNTIENCKILSCSVYMLR